jgi:small GTP-binding protein
MSKENKKEEENRSNAIKAILVGDSGTGKTQLITVAAGFEFNSTSLTTTSCSYVQIKVEKNNREYKINLWDTIGQEKYRSLTKIFLKDSKIVIFVYDITNRATFESLKKYWKKIIDDVLGQTPLFGVVGNKNDLYLDEKVKEEEGEEFAKSINAKFLYTSAKNESKAFIKFIEQILDDYVGKSFEEREESIIIERGTKKKKEKCC